MSGFNDLCECLCRQFQSHLDAVQNILSTVNSAGITTSQGFDSSRAAFGLEPPPSSGLFSRGSNGNSSLAMITMIILFVVMLLSLRRQVQELNRGSPHRRPLSSSSSSSSSADDVVKPRNTHFDDERKEPDPDNF